MDASAGAVHIGHGSGVTATRIKTPNIYVNTHVSNDIIIRGSSSTALRLTETGGMDYVTLDSSNAKVIIGSGWQR